MNGEDQAQLAFDTLMAEVRAELGPHATLNAIEAALVQRQPLLMRSIIQQLQQEAPPAEELLPLGAEWIRDGRGHKWVSTLWGKVQTPVQRWRQRSGGKTTSTLIDPDLDGSGWTEQALTRLLDMAVRLPYQEASGVVCTYGLSISGAELARLFECYSKDADQHVKNQLHALELLPLEAPREKGGRVMVLQADGVFVLGRTSVTPEQGSGIEIKTALVYPQQAPQQRTRLASVCTASEFLPLCSGLLRHAGLRLQDTLVAVTDGALWLAFLCEVLGVSQHILDVYHSSMYLSVVMEALGWSSERREAMQIQWVQGQWSGRKWLETHLPSEMRSGWSTEAHTAVSYLKKRLDMMEYPRYQERGFPIGSGQIEGMNKQVIGGRMKGSGMRWTRPGARTMAAVRAQHFSVRPLVSVKVRRHAAFPRPTPKF